MAESLEAINTRLEGELVILNNTICDKEAKKILLLSEIEADPNFAEFEKQKNSHKVQKVENDLQFEKCRKEIETLDRAINNQKMILTSFKENDIDIIIKRLETDLSRNNYSLRDEKKMVLEIDNAKRSKKLIGHYNNLLKEREQKKSQKELLRRERDRLEQVSRSLKRNDDQLKLKGRFSRESSVVLSNEIDELKNKVKEIISCLVDIKSGNYKIPQHFSLPSTPTVIAPQPCFRNKPTEPSREAYTPHGHHPIFRKQKSEVHKKSEMKNDEVRKAGFGVQRPSKLSIVGDPHGLADTPKEKACKILIAHLKMCFQSTPSPSNQSNCSSLYTTPAETPTDLLLFNPPAESFLRIKDRKKMSKPIAHHPEVIGNFALVGIEPPHSKSDIPRVMDALHQQLKLYEAEKKLQMSANSSDSVNTVIAVNNSIKSSATTSNSFNDHCPTTIQIKPSHPTIYTTSRLRRNSLDSDSGVGELESQTNSSGEIVLDVSQTQK